MEALKTPTRLQASVIIPAHNRRESLRNTLLALSSQTLPPDQFEVIVVADGCTDGTGEMVRQFESPLQLHLIEQTQAGPAAARNCGAAQAGGRWLIFLDDDMQPQPQFVEAHLRLHQDHPGLVVIGYAPPLLEEQRAYFRNELLDWWEIMFQKMRSPAHRFSYNDLVSGNFSLEAALFNRVGQFDSSFTCHEDYELGVRLQQAGAPFAFSMQALAYHHERTGLDRSLQRKYAEGVADVWLGRRYLELRPTLLIARLERYSLLPSRVLRFLAFTRPGLGDWLAAILRRGLDFFERVRGYRNWQRLLYGLMGYWYWRGVAAELGTLSQLKRFLAEGETLPSAPALEIDLAAGVLQAEQLLDQQRPASVRVCLNRQWIGDIPDQPGAERLRGAHLRPILANGLSASLLKALALDDSLGYPEVTEKLVALCDEMLKKHA